MKSTETYEKAFSDVLNVLIKNGCASLRDFDILHAWLLHYPYSLGDGRYCYQNKFYENIEDLPLEVREELRKRGEI